VEALKNGFDEAIMLNTAGKVIEASAENIFIVRDKVLITPPVDSGALNGITRDSVLAISQEYGNHHEIRDISRDETYISDEVFLTGTASGIRAVGYIDNRTIGNGKIGTVTNQIKTKFEAIIRGKDNKFGKKWLTYVN
jgi:branched-chain amino acid aminotransferase